MKNNFIKLIAVFIIIFLTGCNSLKEAHPVKRPMKIKQNTNFI